MFQGIDAVKPGARVSDIGAAVQHHVEGHGFSVVREFVGHGIGTSLHEEPQVANYGPAGSGPRLSEGMVLAIEPMVNAGRPSVKVQSDGWTAVTTDGSLSAHFEHTVVVTREGTEILTLLAEDVARVARLRQMLPAARGALTGAGAQWTEGRASARRPRDGAVAERVVSGGRGRVRGSRRTSVAGTIATSCGCSSAIESSWS